jgi:hypothetical protein
MPREGGYDELTIEAGLKKLEGGLAMACNDSGADLVRRAREEIACLRAVVRDVRLMANAGNFSQWEGEPWLQRVRNINLHW